MKTTGMLVSGLRKLLLVSMVAFVLLPGVAQAQWEYVVTNGAVSITKGYCPQGAVTIPETIDGYPVTSIGGSAFRNCQSLRSVTIPNSVTSIGDWAFSYCRALISVAIPNTVTNLGDVAFGYCSSLTSVTIPSGVFSIGVEAFSGCTGLTSATIPMGVTDIGVGAFRDCTSLTSITIPNSVTSIGAGAFLYCYRLASIAIPNSVISIGPDVFRFCGLTNVTMGSSVTSIGDYAFGDCYNLTSVTIPNSVTNIGDGAFYGCARLAGVYFEGSAPDSSEEVFEVFAGAANVAVYHLAETTGWGSTSYDRPTALWLPKMQTTDGGFGVQTNQFGFTISWASDKVVVVEASTDLANPIWSPVSTNTLAGGTSYFTDPQWASHPMRFYRVRAP